MIKLSSALLFSLLDDDGHERARLHISNNNETVFSLYDQHDLKMSLRVAEEDSHITIFSKVDGLNADENAERVFIGYQMQTERGIAEPRLSLTDSAGDEALRLISWGIQTLRELILKGELRSSTIRDKVKKLNTC